MWLLIKGRDLIFLQFSFFMSYFRYIDNGEGPTKLFIGGLHGNEGKTSIKFIKRIKMLK